MTKIYCVYTPGSEADETVPKCLGRYTTRAGAEKHEAAANDALYVDGYDGDPV